MGIYVFFAWNVMDTTEAEEPVVIEAEYKVDKVESKLVNLIDHCGLWTEEV